MIFVKPAQSLLRKFGFELKTMAVPVYAEQRLVNSAAAMIDGYTMLSQTRVTSLADQVTYCNKNNIEGAFVECGVWKGGAVGLMAMASKASGRSNRVLHLFDSFTDICAPDPAIDGEKAIAEAGGRATYVPGQPTPLTGIYDNMGGHGTIESCKELIIDKVQYPSESLIFHKGWFQDTVAAASAAVGPIAILRLDGDWYESTKVCLEGLYDNVVSGGFVVIDDYLAYEGCRKAVDEFIEKRKLKVFLARVDTGCYFFVKQ